jgi:DNA-binding MarR family transcriptional regulator
MESGKHDPVALFLRGILAIGRRVRAERPPNALSLSGLGILGSLNRLGPLVATRLASEERLQPQSLTRLIADLERSQLITRTRSKHDRREITIAISAKGRRVLLEDIALRREWLEMAMHAALSPKEREALLSASALMLKLAAYQPAHPESTDT